MEILAGLSIVCLIASALLVAIKTLTLWRRTRALPELLLSVMLFSVTVLGYPIALACMFIPAKRFLAVHIAHAFVLNGGFACLSLSCIATIYFWTTIESLGYYRQLRLRIRLGLADVAVANRILLWGLMTLAAGIAVVLNSLALQQGTMANPLTVALSSGLGIVHAGCLFFAFHAPAWYRSWIERRSPAEVG